MKPEFRKVSSGPAQSFSARQDFVPDINNKWHYHHEVELIHFNTGSGTHFVGDNIRRFQSGDLVLIGSNLPHFTRFDTEYFEGATPDIRVIHFKENFWGNEFLNLPENALIKSLLEKGRSGLLIEGKGGRAAATMMAEMINADGYEKLLLLIKILNTIALSDSQINLSSVGFNHNFADSEKDRITDIHEFTLNNFNKKIYIHEVAEVARMSPNSFCRYFKSRMQKTYSQFLIEIKVGQACKLLIENRLNLKQICYESGFNNPVTFHRYFKKFTGKSPLNYQKEFGLNS